MTGDCCVFRFPRSSVDATVSVCSLQCHKNEVCRLHDDYDLHPLISDDFDFCRFKNQLTPFGLTLIEHD